MTEPTVSPGLAAGTSAHEQATSDEGDSGGGLAGKIESLLIKGRLEEAENAVLSGLKRTNSYHYCILGKVWAAQNRTGEAMEAFRQAVSMAPMSAPERGHLAAFLLKNGELWEAETEIRKAIRLDPELSSYHTTLGEVLLEQRFFEDAHASLRRAIRLNRRNVRPRELLARLLAMKGKYRRAKKVLARAHVIDPSSASVLWNLSKIFEEQGKADEAVAAMREACKLVPANQAYRTRLASLSATSTITTAESGPSHTSAEPTVRGRLSVSASKLIENMRIIWRRIKID